MFAKTQTFLCEFKGSICNLKFVQFQNFDFKINRKLLRIGILRNFKTGVGKLVTGELVTGILVTGNLFGLLYIFCKSIKIFFDPRFGGTFITDYFISGF